MPLYEYECTACHRRLEKIQKFSDPELTECPHCGGKLERTITAPSFQFAGGGWYKDLYSSAKPAGGEGKSDSKPAASGDSGSSAPATTAPAAAPAAAPASAPTASSSGASKP
ncbi:zinc ribbon domain-containing protein [Granulicella sp. 5B5]|uniref:FmdB family zinc ribbon protein n=1 Tax=Granulicella sp. 5B5 TaxID=1617967 RepID=UPI0015F6958F|nr:zinc ribbon domain-containing protein [Granulicella sp. 5B5]QMV18941.1 zinc ribbon domain-containing protein [Granulicella sp. 5B5]